MYARPASPVSGPKSCTDPTTGPAVGAMPALSIAPLHPSHHIDSRPPPAKRPKLSLTTSMVPLTFGRLTTGLRSAAVTDSPTVRNTYVNASKPYRRSTTSSPSTPPQTSQTARIATHSPVRAPVSPYRQEAPHKTPLGIRGILRNGPLPRRHFSATSARTPRLLFPDVKHVCYRSPLEEVVPAGRTLSDTDEVSERESPSRTTDDVKDASRRAPKRTSETESHGRSEDHADRSEITARGCRKRRREWVWTLEDSPEPAKWNVAGVDKGMELTRKSGIGLMDGFLYDDTFTVVEALPVGTGEMVGKGCNV